MEKIKNLIVGAGFSGATLARKIAEELNEEVLVIDAKNHIAGNCYDYWDKNGICIQQYGPHIFHTYSKMAWDFISRFTKFYPYMHHVTGYIDGQEITLPYNLNTLYQVFPKFMAEKFERKLVEQFGFDNKIAILELQKTDDADLRFLADFIYRKVFLRYTAKQWDLKPEDLDPSITGRVPIRINRDNRYFQDPYQGIPLQGYTKAIEEMLNHPNIQIQLNTPFETIKGQISYDRLFYTGPIDAFFEYQLGELPYRSLKFDLIEFEKSHFQSGSVVNYPNNYDFTRIGEYKHFLDNQTTRTVVSFEYPQAFKRGENDRYYPIVKEENLALYNQYLEKAKEHPNVHFLGRLGDYKYYDMDKAILRALEVFERIKNA